MHFRWLFSSPALPPQLQSTFPDQKFTLRPLQLGTVLDRSGMLGKSGKSPSTLIIDETEKSGPEARAAAGSEPLPVVLIGARGEKREAKKLGWSGEEGLHSIPLFEIGTLESKLPGGGTEDLWPLFLRYEDAEATWRSFSGESGPMPHPKVTSLGDLIECVRKAMPLPGRPSLCDPLDSVEYCNRLSRVAAYDESENGRI